MIEATGSIKADWGDSMIDALVYDTTQAMTIRHDILLIVASQGKQVIRIAHDGRIFWHEREVETDDDYRAAMMELAQQLAAQMRPPSCGPT